MRKCTLMARDRFQADQITPYYSMSDSDLEIGFYEIRHITILPMYKAVAIAGYQLIVLTIVINIGKVR